mmetsp:Transcript_5363/g.6554  ORF Transcript_5363/g.6554 Transcript_5363/m.6554 type:complete len:215 (-) Transcript_5363:163-807(-)
MTPMPRCRRLNRWTNSRGTIASGVPLPSTISTSSDVPVFFELIGVYTCRGSCMSLTRISSVPILTVPKFVEVDVEVDRVCTIRCAAILDSKSTNSGSTVVDAHETVISISCFVTEALIVTSPSSAGDTPPRARMASVPTPSPVATMRRNFQSCDGIKDVAPVPLHSDDMSMMYSDAKLRTQPAVLAVGVASLPASIMWRSVDFVRECTVPLRTE